MRNFSALMPLPVWRACCMLLFLFLAANTGAIAQVDTTQVDQKLIIGKRIIIETKDGSVIQGKYMGHTENGIKVQTESAGELTIPNDQITWMKVVEDDRFKDGEYWFENPNATRYLFSPSAFSLKKGEAYYQNTYLIINSFNFGVTDNLTIGGGFELYSTVTGDPIFFISPKYSFPISKNLRAGAGLLYVNALDSNDGFTGLGIGYGIVTYGNTDDNITVGLGYGFVEKELSEKPVFTFSGMKRLSRRFGLVSENWLVPTDDYYGIYSYGLRFMGERMTVDFAFLNNPDIASDVTFIGFPYIDFVIRFGK